MFAWVIVMHKSFLLVSLLTTMLVLGHAPIAAAEVTKQQAASIAKSQFQGRIITVDESKQNDAAVYRVKVLDTGGGMHTVVIDKQSGNVISAH